ncbi:hypothetical protein [Lactobacillus sp. Sy-1]|uniref:hypothetical protein n=1 Tax=Lactobacillus sp. Sy-1 TaxID=2109645 RepID=UPI001C5B5E3F|nr:hypothetical protein [Lactobacillus sp. Sy-1]MBW1605915.1 hypothetical protein [Lactobacillus sp. Sy-1]
MRKKPLTFTDQVEFNVITKQVQKRLKGHFETIHGTFYTDLQTGIINLTIWNDMDADFGFQEALTLRSNNEFIVLSDDGDAYKVINVIYRDQHGSDIDPIIANRIYKDSIDQYYQSNHTKPFIDHDSSVPKIIFPFKTLTEIGGVLEQMNMMYFLLVRNTNSI